MQPVVVTIKQYCEHAGLSVVALAKLAGINPSVLYRWERGKCEAGGENIKKLVLVTNGLITANDLLGIKTDKANQK